MGRKSTSRVMGIGSGLIPKDLNARAQIALMGFSDCPSDDLVLLLRSEQPINRKTRDQLADAIAGRSRGLTIKLSNPRKGSFIMSLLRKAVQVAEGRFVRGLIEEDGYDKAVEKMAVKKGLSKKAAEARLTLANKVDAWIEKAKTELPEAADFDALTLETAYLLAEIMNIEPIAAIDDQLPPLVEWIRQFRQIENSAFGPEERFIA